MRFLTTQGIIKGKITDFDFILCIYRLFFKICFCLEVYFIRDCLFFSAIQFLQPQRYHL